MNLRKQTNLRRNQQQKAAVTVPATERGRDPPLRGVDAQLRKNYLQEQLLEFTMLLAVVASVWLP
jgi:hypothetical protein